MYFRNISVAIVSSLVASGAWLAYKGGYGTNGAKEQLDTANSRSFGADTTTTPTPESKRKALVVDQNNLLTATISGDAPLTKETDDYGRRVLEMMTPEQATQRLRRNEESYWVDRGKGVVRYDMVQLASNDPIEDDHAEKIIEVSSAAQAGENKKSDWMFWGVFDGHSGWTTSAKLRQALIHYVARELNNTHATANTSSLVPSAESIDAAMKRGFVSLDTHIVHDSVSQVLKSKSKPQAATLLAPALSGSCALLSFYDTRSKTLRVACTGTPAPFWAHAAPPTRRNGSQTRCPSIRPGATPKKLLGCARSTQVSQTSSPAGACWAAWNRRGHSGMRVTSGAWISWSA